MIETLTTDTEMTTLQSHPWPSISDEYSSDKLRDKLRELADIGDCPSFVYTLRRLKQISKNVIETITTTKTMWCKLFNHIEKGGHLTGASLSFDDGTISVIGTKIIPE